MMSLPDHCYSTLCRLSDTRRYLIAYSGGLDSHVLLHALSRLRDQHPDLQLRAVHVHHGLSPNADTWATHCKTICDNYRIPFLLRKVNIKEQGLKEQSPLPSEERVRVRGSKPSNLEALARHARYHAISEVLQNNECLVTAHTLDDQAETLLLQLLRGAGVNGLASMPSRKPFAHHLLLRPFLTTTRETLEAYANAQQLTWIEDDSNNDLHFDRNYCRHQILPLLKARWPAVLENLSRSAKHCASASGLMKEFAEEDLFNLEGLEENTLSVSALLDLSKVRCNNALRHWLQQKANWIPSTQQLQQLTSDVLHCDQDATPMMVCGTFTCRRYRDDLFLMPERPAIDSDLQIPWDLKSPLTLPGHTKALQPAPYLAQFDPVTIRYRRGGERIKPKGSAHSQSLKKLFQNWGVPPWERDRIPLIYSGTQLVAVLGYCIVE